MPWRDCPNCAMQGRCRKWARKRSKIQNHMFLCRLSCVKIFVIPLQMWPRNTGCASTRWSDYVARYGMLFLWLFSLRPNHNHIRLHFLTLLSQYGITKWPHKWIVVIDNRIATLRQQIKVSLLPACAIICPHANDAEYLSNFFRWSIQNPAVGAMKDAENQAEIRALVMQKERIFAGNVRYPRLTMQPCLVLNDMFQFPECFHENVFFSHFIFRCFVILALWSWYKRLHRCFAGIGRIAQ